jgi:hypothetical protein
MSATVPVTGRSEPRSSGESVTHVLRYWGAINEEFEGSIVVACDGCPGWKRRLEGGHTVADLARLEAQHNGEQA